MLTLRKELLLLCAFMPLLAFGEIYKVVGKVVTDESEPEAFATVRIYAANDTVKALALGVTDDEGAFALALPKASDYQLVVSSVGKLPIVETFAVSPSQPLADLGTLTIRENAAQLAEVEVTARKPLVKKEIDRIGYDVAADEDARTATLQDVLRKVPMVTVEPDGTIKVRGSSDFKIYKNGRPNNSFTKNAKEIFAAIPAAMIKKIEVITDPGAKEDAEGVGAILNIVTDDNSSVDGIMGNVNLHYPFGSPTPSGSIWLTGDLGKVALSAHGGYFRQYSRISKNSTDKLKRFLDSGNLMRENQSQTSDGNIGYWGVDGSYEPDSLNLFTFEFGGFMYDVSARTNIFTSMTAPDGTLAYSYRNRVASPCVSYMQYNGNFNYQHLTHRKGEIFTLSYQVSSDRNRQNNEWEFSEMVNFPADYTAMFDKQSQWFIEHTIQADWTRPIGKRNFITVGAKYIDRNNRSLSHDEYVGVGDYDSHFRHRTAVAAGYFDWRCTLGAVSLRAGLRYEYSRLSAKFLDGSGNPFASSLNDWVPNASLMWTVSDVSTWKLAYTTRINRPGINYLDPSRNITPTSLSYGNPDLESVHHNSVSINYSLIKQKFNLDMTASYDFADNVITKVVTVDERDFTTSTYANVGKDRSLRFDLFGQWTLTPKTTLMANTGTFYRQLQIPGIGNARWGFEGFFRVAQMLPWNLRLEGMAFYETGALNNVYSYGSSGLRGLFYGFSLQRQFLKENRLTVKFETRCPFSPRGTKEVTITNRGDYRGRETMRMEGVQVFAVSVGYRFGSVRAQVKKTVKSITNDDIQGGNKAPSTGAI